MTANETDLASGMTIRTHRCQILAAYDGLIAEAMSFVSIGRGTRSDLTKSDHGAQPSSNGRRDVRGSLSQSHTNLVRRP